MEEQKENQELILVPINKEGLLNFSDQIQLGQAAQIIIQMKMAPNNLLDGGKPAVMSALMLAKQFRLPVSALNEMAFIHGKITCYGSLVTALAERHPDYGDHRILFLDKDQKVISYTEKNLNAEVWACVFLVKKKGDDNYNEFYFTMDDADKAGINKNVFKSYRKDMLYHKAKARAFKASYASALNGIEYHEEFIHREQPEPTPLDNLNERLGLKDVGSNDGSFEI